MSIQDEQERINLRAQVDRQTLRIIDLETSVACYEDLVAELRNELASSKTAFNLSESLSQERPVNADAVEDQS